MTGRILDGKTIAGVLWLKNQDEPFARRSSSPDVLA